MTPEGAEDYFVLQGLAVMLLGSFIVGIRCSGAITGERERQTWEAVLLTPMSAKQLVTGKLWGVMGACYWYLLAYGVPAVLLSALGGVGCLGWTVLVAGGDGAGDVLHGSGGHLVFGPVENLVAEPTRDNGDGLSLWFCSVSS